MELTNKLIRVSEKYLKLQKEYDDLKADAEKLVDVLDNYVTAKFPFVDASLLNIVSEWKTKRGEK